MKYVKHFTDRSKIFVVQYTKAVNAIMGLNFEITEDNAKLLASKGKNGLKVGESRDIIIIRTNKVI